MLFDTKAKPMSGSVILFAVEHLSNWKVGAADRQFRPWLVQQLAGQVAGRQRGDVSAALHGL